MAKQHKRATEVSLAPVEEKSALQESVERYWKPAAVVAVLVSAVILYTQWKSQAAQEERGTHWDALASELNLGGLFGQMTTLPSGREVADLAATLEGTDAGPTASLLAVSAYLDEGDMAGARAAASRLRELYPDHPLVTEPHAFEAGSPSLPTLEFLEGRIDAIETWREGRSGLFENPALPADAPRVRIQTDQGDLVVGLYTDRAPNHAEQFLEHCRDGYYVNTKLHRVVPGFMIQGGDPNSIEGDPATWGQGGPGFKIDPEIDDALSHFPGVLAAAKGQFDTQSSGSQFYITTGSRHQLDGQYTIFGLLLEGEDVAGAIDDLPRVEGTERPEVPAVVQAVVVLE